MDSEVSSLKLKLLEVKLRVFKRATDAIIHRTVTAGYERYYATWGEVKCQGQERFMR